MQPFPALTLFRNKPAFVDLLNISMDFSLPTDPAASWVPYPFFDSDHGSFQMLVSFYLLAGSAGLRFANRMCSFSHSWTIMYPSDITMRLSKSIWCPCWDPLPPVISSNLEFFQMEISSWLASSASSMLMNNTQRKDVEFTQLEIGCSKKLA